ncbi:MAG TPA: hypothetical protein VMS17_33755 [Gemmataceae bacterium]|nr:hypothetical protein [Gemmataceae bacterium]
MTALAATRAMTTPPQPLTLQQFLDHVRLTNPFVIDRVVQPALAGELDAERVHQGPFRRLLDLAQTARDQHTGVGAVLWGEAGVGKSHLLSRLARWAHQDDNACFVYLQNMQPGPEHLPRSLLRVTVSILTQGRQDLFHQTPLYRLVEAAVETALRESARTVEPAQAYAALLDRLAAQAPAQPAFVDRTTYDVLFRFLRSASSAAAETDDGLAALAVRWLSGDSVDADEAVRLGLPPGPHREEGTALADDQQIKLVFVALSQMALFARRPLLLCFDQVENISPEQMQAQARFLQALIDGAPNLLVVTCGVYETLLRWRTEGMIHAAAWDRLAQFEIQLPRVTPHEARQIVETRLDHFLTPFLELEPVKKRVQQDHLFPLGVAWFDEALKDKVELRPRDVIRQAYDGWGAAQRALRELGGPRWLAEWGKTRTPKPDGKKPPSQRPAEPLEDVIDRKVAAKLEEQKRQRQLDPPTLPPDADNLAGLVYALLRQCLQSPRPYALTEVQRPVAPKGRQQATYHLVVRQGGGKETTIGVLILANSDAASAVWALRRVVEERRPTERLLLVTDQRRPLRLAKKGSEYLDQLKRNYGERFQRIDLTFDRYADLDALKATSGMALSGDVEIDLPDGASRRLTEAEVIASHHRQDRYVKHVLLGSLLNAEPVPAAPPIITPPPPAPSPQKNDAQEFIMAQLALMPGASSQELRAKYREYLAATKRPPLDPPALKALLAQAAGDLHRAGHVHVTPIENDEFFVLPRKR